MTVAADIAAAPDVEQRQRIRGRLSRPMPSDRLLGWALPLVLAALALLVRLWRITRPHGKVFDEVYYAHDAWNLLHHGVELDAGSHDRAAGFVVHPPLGKWMIAVGEAIFGNTPLGWRFSGAVVGSLAVLMVARIGRRMFRSTRLGCIAGLLLSLDALEFVQSRTSMLDIFLMFWVLAAFGCLVLDRDQGRARLLSLVDRGGDAGGSLGARPWRWACGFCLGAATAVKWDGLFWIPLFLLLALWWDATGRRTAGASRPARSVLLRDAPTALGSFVLLTVAVYTVSWTGWFVSDGAYAFDHDRYVHAGQSWFAHDRAVVGGWLRYQWEMWNFHSHLDAAHPYLSRPWGWLLLARPVAYFYSSSSKACGAGTCSQEVLGIGTPAIWWLSIPALVAVLWRVVARFDWRAVAVLLAFLVGYLPWFAEDAHHRTMFLFYMMPVVPFMVLALTMAAGMVLGTVTAGRLRRFAGATAVAVYLAGVAWNFTYLYPVLSAKVIPYDSWHDRMWLDNCDTSPHRNAHHENAPCWI